MSDEQDRHTEEFGRPQELGPAAGQARWSGPDEDPWARGPEWSSPSAPTAGQGAYPPEPAPPLPWGRGGSEPQSHSPAWGQPSEGSPWSADTPGYGAGSPSGPPGYGGGSPSGLPGYGSGNPSGPPAYGASGPGGQAGPPGYGPGGTFAGGPYLGGTPDTDTLGRPVRERRGPSTSLLIALVTVVGLLAGGLGSGATWWLLDRQEPATTSDPVSLPNVPKGSGDRPEGSISNVSKELLPSVVSIKVKGGNKAGTGSGFVIKGGYIITNNHVVAPAKDSGAVRVTFQQGNRVPATIVGSDPTSDIAVLQPEKASNLDPAPLGNSKNVVVGDRVVAIGSPLGLKGTVTSGIVSAMDRPVVAGGKEGGTAYINAIQTDAPINPGNSGGPLVNMSGKVVGVNAAIATMGGPLSGASGNIGVGFAIPINQARQVAQQIINQGYATHAVIGAFVDLSYQGRGARIATDTRKGQPPVRPNGPADQAGLEPGDVVVSFDGQDITSAKELIVAIQSHVAGETVPLTYVRNSQEHKAQVTLQASKS